MILSGLFASEEVSGWSQECDRLLKSDVVDPRNIRTPFRMNSGERPERIDPVVDISPTFCDLVQDPRLTGVVAGIFQDTPLLFKDKIIFKAPGTLGYTPHQDQAWWHLCAPDDILSVSIQIDGASASNGCLEVFSGYHDRLLSEPGVKRNLSPEEGAALDARKHVMVETKPGDVVIFHSLTPHQSGKNTSDQWRRSLYLTFAAARQGDFYDQQLEEYKDRLLTEAKDGEERFFR